MQELKQTITTFSVPFVLGKQRPRVTAHGTYTPARTRKAEAAVRAAYIAAGGGIFARHVPVEVTITTQRPLPKSRPKRTAIEPDTFKPDADNVGKLVLDALNGVAYADDGQVTRLTVRKRDRDRLQQERTIVTVSPAFVYGGNDD